jgi:Rap1a immunity proteins
MADNIGVWEIGETIMKRPVLFLGAMLLASTPAAADTMPAQILIDTCKQTTEEGVAVCSAYFMGVLETIAIDGSTKFCVSGVTPMQLRDKFMAHAATHPPAPRANASELVSAVLTQSHACR